MNTTPPCENNTNNHKKKIPLYPKWNCFHMEFPPLHGTREPLEKSILVVERNRIKMRPKKEKKKGESSHRKQNFVRV